MINMGKQAYNSNDQKFDEYLTVTLDPYLVQGEQAGRTKWLPQEEQPYTYFKYERAALLRMSPESRAKYYQTQISSGQRTPDETRATDDYGSYASMSQEGGDRFYMASNIQPIGGNNAPN
jgi:phage portal protein BeeE